MKKLFTIDDFMVAFISALGYGFGETISRLLGWSDLMCGIASLVVGLILGEIINNIAFSKAVQKKPENRVMVYIAFFLIFIAAHTFSSVWMGVSMLDYLMDEFQFTIILPVIGFVVNMIIRGYRVRQIHKLYGDGSNGYVFDIDKEVIEEFNKQNQPVSGEYDEDSAVKTKSGIYIGKKEDDTISYLGIPYAKPPVGELRWKAPEPLPASEAVFEAKHFGASAIQVEQKGLILKHHRQSEDCLTLNVFVSDDDSDSKKPVIVLFHDGDFSFGGSADPLLDVDSFVQAHPDTVFVSFNYRLGIFGFIDFSEIPGGEAYPDTLNLGLLDQIAALKWIKENISAFGGDPDRITAIGLDCGATSICLLAASGQAKELFQKAFVFNCNPIAIYDDRDGARTLAKNLLKETNTASMNELMQLDTPALKSAAQRLWLNMCAPTCDGNRFPEIYHAFESGAACGIDFIISFSSSETQVFKSLMGEKNYKDYMSVALTELKKLLDDSVYEEVEDYIRTQAASIGEYEAQSKLVEQCLSLCIYLTAVKLKKGGNKVHMMYWNEKPLIENLGSGIIDAAANVLGNSEAAQLYGTVLNKDLSETLQSLLIKFINGEPLQLYQNEIKGLGALNWQAFPKALIVSDEELRCGSIEKRLTEVKGLLDLVTKE